MIRCVILLLLLTMGVGQAQTPSLIPVPQNVPIPLVPNGLDANGILTSRLLTPLDLPTILPVSTSSSTAVLGFGQMAISLDSPGGFVVGQIVQVTAPDGEYLIGAIVALDLTTFIATINATVPNQGAGIYTSFYVKVIGGSQLNGVPIWGGLSIDGTNLIANPTAAGQTVNMTVETGKSFTNFSDVYVWAPEDINTWFIATVVTYDPTTGALSLFVKQTANSGGSFTTNYVSLISAATVEADLTAYSSTAFNGATVPSTLKMTVTLPGAFTGGGGGASNLVAGYTAAFDIQAGKYFPVNGSVVIDDLTPGTQHNHYIAVISSYSGSTLSLTIQSVFGTSTPSSAWSIYLINGPANLPYASHVLTGDVALNNVSNFFDGPSMAQGTSGTWYASGTVALSDPSAATINCKLWDGTTVMSSSSTTIGATGIDSVTLTGILATPAGNVRISCKDVTNTTGKILFDASGLGKDSSIWGMRIQ